MTDMDRVVKNLKKKSSSAQFYFNIYFGRLFMCHMLYILLFTSYHGQQSVLIICIEIGKNKWDNVFYILW